MQSPASGAAERWTLADEGPWPGLLRAGLACAVAVAAWQLAGGELLALLRLLRPWSRPSVAWAAMGTIRFDQNYGKRAGLEAGFRRARGEIVVTIDSDSVIDRGSLLAMAGAFRDPRVGAVAGRVAVYNRTSGLLPRMLDVRFLLSFD